MKTDSAVFEVNHDNRWIIARSTSFLTYPKASCPGATERAALRRHNCHKPFGEHGRHPLVLVLENDTPDHFFQSGRVPQEIAGRAADTGRPSPVEGREGLDRGRVDRDDLVETADCEDLADLI